MAKRRRSGGGSLKFIVLFVVLTGVAAGAGYWFIQGSMNLPRRPAENPKQTGIVVSHRHRQVNVFLVKVENDESVLVPELRTVRAGEDPRQAALELLIEASRSEGPSKDLIPAGTKLLGVEVRNGIAYADFSRQIRDNFNGGSTSEGLLINSIVHTLTQFKGVEKVQILVEGKKIDSIGDHIEISEPLMADSTMLGTQGDKE